MASFGSERAGAGGSGSHAHEMCVQLAFAMLGVLVQFVRRSRIVCVCVRAHGVHSCTVARYWRGTGE
eukprot:1736419-Alexandrium_andersonii.AAC.1